MAAKIKITTEATESNEGDAAVFYIEAWEEPDITVPISIEVTAGHDWFDDEQKFWRNLRSYTENELQRFRNQQAKEAKVDAMSQVIKANVDKEIDLDTIDLGGQP